jgi:hypothetical protein
MTEQLYCAILQGLLAAEDKEVGYNESFLFRRVRTLYDQAMKEIAKIKAQVPVVGPDEI